MDENALTPEQILQMQAAEKFARSNKPRIKSTQVLATIVEFVNSGDTSTVLDAKFADKEQAFVKQIKANKALVGLVWPIKDDDGLHLVRLPGNTG